jgi:urease accessory protein
MPTRIEASQLLLLLTWMSPAFPTGAFAYSQGLEWAIDEGRVTDRESLLQWIRDILTRGGGWNDAVIFARCWEDDASALNELALAMSSSRERYLETTQLGRAFCIAAAVFTAPQLAEQEIAYPVAAGAACAAMGIDRHAALLAYLQSLAGVLTSVAVRLVPIGQTAGLEVLRDLGAVIAQVSEKAASASLDDLGAIAIGADIASMKHETMYSRVFRT